MIRLRNRWTQILLWAGLAVAAVVVGCYFYQYQRAQLSHAILAKVDRLALNPPNGTTELQWAVYVYWTHNLHCETIPQFYASYWTLLELDKFMDASIAKGPNRKTIDELWDRYAAISDSGRRYRLKYEPWRDSAAESIAAEGIKYADVGSYESFLAYVRSSNSR